MHLHLAQLANGGNFNETEEIEETIDMNNFKEIDIIINSHNDEDKEKTEEETEARAEAVIDLIISHYFVTTILLNHVFYGA